MSSIFENMSEQMKQDYLNGNLQFHRGKIVVGDEEIALVEMNKGEVITCNFNRLFKTMKENEKSPRMRKGFASIGLFIQGWEDVPEPIYEITEIRRFYMKLYRKMPHFMYYIAPIGNLPQYILACIGDIEVKARHGNFVSPLELMKNEGHTRNIGATTISVSLPGEIGYTMIESIEKHAKELQFQDEDNELPIIYKLIENTIKKEERLNKYS